jgi:erythromycin esterase-like protein
VDEALAEGITHGLGVLAANRELVEWMRERNAGGKTAVRFHGCDAPTEMSGCDSPRRALHRALDFLEAVDAEKARPRRERIEALLGNDAAWENPATMMDPSKGIGLSAEAGALRVETEELIAELEVRRPELVAAGGREEFAEALQFARLARKMLAYHAGIARASATRIADLLGLRDVMMAEAIEYIAEMEKRRGGRVLVFAHNSHLKTGQMRWELGWTTGPSSVEWWAAGAHLQETMGARYAVIGVGVGTSEAHGLSAPEAGTIEARMLGVPGPWRIAPVGGVSGEGIAMRGKAAGNPTYFGFSAASVREYDWLCVVVSCTYSRGPASR